MARQHRPDPVVTRKGISAADGTWKPTAQRLSDQVATYLRGRILRGELRSGDRLIETELSEQMGISRAPIREALAALRREGLATTMPYRGAVVASYDERDLEEITQLRAALEGLAARYAAVRDPDSAAAKVRERIDQMITVAQQSDGLDAAVAHIEVHRAIGEASGFDRLVAFLDQLAAQSLALWSYAELSRQELVSLATDHQAIVEAIKTGDPELAQLAIQEHVSLTSEPVKAALQRWNSPAGPAPKDDPAASQDETGGPGPSLRRSPGRSSEVQS